MTVRFGTRRRRPHATRAPTRCGVACAEYARRRASIALRDRAATARVPWTSIASVANSKNHWTMDIRSLSTWAFAALVCGGAAGGLLPLAAGAQPDHDLIAGLDACAALQRAEARLDCYDELARRAHASPSAARSATTEPPQPAATATPPPNETHPPRRSPARPRPPRARRARPSSAWHRPPPNAVPRCLRRSS